MNSMPLKSWTLHELAIKLSLLPLVLCSMWHRSHNSGLQALVASQCSQTSIAKAGWHGASGVALSFVSWKSFHEDTIVAAEVIRIVYYYYLDNYNRSEMLHLLWHVPVLRMVGHVNVLSPTDTVIYTRCETGRSVSHQASTSPDGTRAVQ